MTGARVNVDPEVEVSLRVKLRLRMIVGQKVKILCRWAVPNCKAQRQSVACRTTSQEAPSPPWSAHGDDGPQRRAALTYRPKLIGVLALAATLAAILAFGTASALADSCTVTVEPLLGGS